MTAEELVKLWTENCSPGFEVYADYSACIYKVIDGRTYHGKVIIDEI